MTLPDRPCHTPPEEGKRWWQEPRWKGKPPPPSDQWSAQRTRAAAARRHGLIFGDDEANKQLHGVALAACATGGELVAAMRKGDFFGFPLEERRGRVMVPVGAKWNLRGKRVELLRVIVAAMIADGGREGLVATLDELGALVNLGRTQVGGYLHELQAWGLIVADPIFVPYGRVCSQRANCYRITKLCALSYRLVVRIELPDPRLVEPRRKRLRRPAGQPATDDSTALAEFAAALTAPGTPVQAPVHLPGVVGSRAHEVALGNPEANPDTPVPGDSSGEPVGLHQKIEHPPTSSGAARPCVPDAVTATSQPAVQGPTRPAGLPREVLDSARSYGKAIAEVRRGNVDRREEPERRHSHFAGEIVKTKIRARELDTQVEVRELERELARREAVAATPPVAPAAAAPPERPAPASTVEIESEEAKQLRLERARRRNNPIAGEDQELADAIAGAFRARGWPAPLLTLHEIATGRGSDLREAEKKGRKS